jgi:hypothetical protein
MILEITQAATGKENPTWKEQSKFLTLALEKMIQQLWDTRHMGPFPPQEGGFSE